MTDEDYINIAIEISKNSKFPYGAIVVKDNKIIGRSDDDTLIMKSLFNHAELSAIESASKNKNLYGDLKGATLYTSCCPCMMCMGAILYEEFKRVVYAATLKDSNDYYNPEIMISSKKLTKLAPKKIEIIGGINREQAIKVLKDAKSSLNK